MLDAQDKQQLCNWQTYFRTVLQYQPHETVGHWETGPEYVCQNQCNRCVRRILSKIEQSYSEKYNKRKVVIKITGFDPLWLFCFVVVCCAGCRFARVCPHLWWSDATGLECGGSPNKIGARAYFTCVAPRTPFPQVLEMWTLMVVPRHIPLTCAHAFRSETHSPDLWDEAPLLSTRQ